MVSRRMERERGVPQYQSYLCWYHLYLWNLGWSAMTIFQRVMHFLIFSNNDDGWESHRQRKVAAILSTVTFAVVPKSMKQRSRLSTKQALLISIGVGQSFLDCSAIRGNERGDEALFRWNDLHRSLRPIASDTSAITLRIGKRKKWEKGYFPAISPRRKAPSECLEFKVMIFWMLDSTYTP